MDDRLLLLSRLRLENYKLHADTEVDLAARPILLITGANGSGKTQVLEALRLCLGVHPTPSRARGMASVIGPAAKDARLTLDIHNPVINEHRLLKPPDEELARALDHDTIRLTTRVTHTGSVQYRIAAVDSEAGGLSISGRQLRDIFRSVNIQAANRLAFTEEGVVDVFAGESGRKKLESLLDATGRLQYLEDLRQALIHLDDALRQSEPLRQKLAWERDLVASIRERLAIIRNRSKYLEQHAALCLEHAWAAVRDFEVARDGLFARTQRADARLERYRASLGEAQDACRRAEADIADRTRQASESREAINREKGTLERLVGHRIRLRQDLGDSDVELKKLQSERDDLGSSLASEKGADKIALLQEREHELVRVEADLRAALREVESVAGQLEAATDHVEPEDAEPPAYAGMTRSELEMIEACATFGRAAAESGLARKLVGPVLSLVGIRAGEEAWEPAVRCLAGRHLFAFIARDREAYAASKRLFDGLFPHRKPPIIVGRIEADGPAEMPQSSHAARGTRHAALPVGVHAFAVDLLEGDPACLAFLRKAVRGAVADRSADANALTDFAEAESRAVLTADCSTFFATFGGFTRPPAPIVTPLGTPLVGESYPPAGSETRGRVGGGKVTGFDVRRLEARQRDLLRRHADLAFRAKKIEDDIRALGVRPQVVERLRTVEERAVALEARLRQMAGEDERLTREIKVLQETVNELIRNEKPLATDIDELQAKARDAQSEIVRCQTLIEEELKVVQRFHEEMATLREPMKAAEDAAQALGKRPPEVRDTTLVAQEMNEVKGKLDAIVGQNVDEDNLRRKEEELAELETYVAERTAHIERLQADVAGRREIWQREVRTMIDHLSRVMQALLRGGAFRDVRLEVDHVENPEKAELAIRARTKGLQWLDYRELSGGEKVLCTESLIMALHTMSDSPVHAIDEFTQRLDKSNAAAAFDIVRKTFEMTARTQRLLVPQFVLLCPEAFGLEENELIHHIVLVEAKLRAGRKVPGPGQAQESPDA